MPAKSAQTRKWIAGALHAARAAAFLTIATGVNGTLSAVWPHYEPIYAYLAAVVIVAFLSSALLGITAAVAAVILYDWMFSPVHVVPSLSIAIPMAVAVLVAIATRAAVAIRQRPVLAVPVSEPALLPSIDRPEPVSRTMPLNAIVDDDRVAALTQQLSIARSKFEDEARARDDIEAAARAREEELSRALDSLQTRVVDQSNRSLATRREFDEMRERLTQADTRTAALQKGLDAAQRRANEEHARAARETTLREQLEVDGHEALQKAVADLAAKYEATLLESKQRLEVATKRMENAQKELKDARALTEKEAALRAKVEAVTAGAQKELKDARALAERESALRAKTETTGAAALQKSLTELTARHEAATADALKRSEAATAKLKALQLELDRTLASLSQEHNRADREARLRSQLELAARETLHRTADVSASHQRDAAEAIANSAAAEERAKEALEQSAAAEQLAAAAQDKVSAADERARAAEERALMLEQQFEQLRFELSELRTSHDEKDGLAASTEDRVFALKTEIDQLRASHEEQLRESHEPRSALQKQLDAARHELQEFQLREEIEGAAHAKLASELASASQELQALRAERETAAKAFADERAAMAKSFDAKLRSIVDGINTDYESAMGDALIERESAKAELRSVSKKLSEAQTLRIELAATRQDLERMKESAQSERDEMNRAFDEKLQRIVAGISADYENSVGDALVEKETAKAEARTLTKKVQEIQQKLDAEVHLREKLDADWGEKLQKIVTHLAEDHEADVGEAMVQKEAAKAEVRTLTGRVAVLQQRLEEERERFRQAAERWQQERTGAFVSPIAPTVEQPMPVPLPVEPPRDPGRPVVVLVVHSDAGVRAMSKHSLQQSGYNVLTAADGLEGLRTATQYRPDVVLTQSVMPKMNARELVQLLKSRRETADVKVVLLSSGSETERGADFRADEIVHNPSDFNDVRAALTNVLARRGVAS